MRYRGEYTGKTGRGQARAYTSRFFRWGRLGRGTRWEGTAGDHKGPPSHSPPPSPLRTDEDVSKKPILERASPAPTILRLRRPIRRMVGARAEWMSGDAVWGTPSPRWRLCVALVDADAIWGTVWPCTAVDSPHFTVIVPSALTLIETPGSGLFAGPCVTLKPLLGSKVAPCAGQTSV